MEAEEEQKYLEQRRESQQGTSSSNSPSPAASGTNSSGSAAAKGGHSYHFICECFFLTAKGLHLGLIKAITDATELHRVGLNPLYYCCMLRVMSVSCPASPVSIRLEHKAKPVHITAAWHHAQQRLSAGDNRDTWVLHGQS